MQVATRQVSSHIQIMVDTPQTSHTDKAPLIKHHEQISGLAEDLNNPMPSMARLLYACGDCV